MDPCTCCCLGGCLLLGRPRWRGGQTEAKGRPPCPEGDLCDSKDRAHLKRFSHNVDDDYGVSMRLYERGQFPLLAKAMAALGDRRLRRKIESMPTTLRQCFQYMDPKQEQLIRDRQVLFKLLRLYAPTYFQGDWKKMKGTMEDIWRDIDSDGNGYISLTEFIEWAGTPDKGGKYNLPKAVGVYGELSEKGIYKRPCKKPNCDCQSFQPEVANGLGVMCPCLAWMDHFLVSGATGDPLFCANCGHKVGHHRIEQQEQAKASIPMAWQSRNAIVAATEHLHSLEATSFWSRCGQNVIAQMQDVMDVSSRAKWTRDRGKDVVVPSGYEVVKVFRNENPRVWLKYICNRTLTKEAGRARKRRLGVIPSFKKCTMTSNSTLLPFREGSEPPEPIDTSINEFYLWHGSTSVRARMICQQEFKQKHAGETTGTLYGPGTYFTDSCTKADEYAKQEVGGEHDGLFCLLLCRVIGGVVKYTAEVTPNPKDTYMACVEGGYDLVLGDREKCRGTFKEYVIYRSDQAYPEYIVFYRRKYDDVAPRRTVRKS